MSIPEQLLDGIKRLDPLPATARRLTAMLGNENTNIQEIADVVQYDAAVAANVLRVANSVAFAGRYPVERVKDAVVRLGTANLLTAILGEYLKFLRAPAPFYNLTEDELWLHGAASSLMIKALTAEARVKVPQTATIAALLHDIGKLIMVRYLKADVSTLLSLCAEKNLTFVEAETELLGCNHAEVGGAIARKWDFPEEITLAIELHHTAIPGGKGLILDAVMLANFAAKSIGIGLGAEGFNMSMDYSGSRIRMGLSIDGFERACAQGSIWVSQQTQENRISS
jgi:putative nucleotidyltransferase with HDIG domain